MSNYAGDCAGKQYCPNYHDPYSHSATSYAPQQSYDQRYGGGQDAQPYPRNTGQNPGFDAYQQSLHQQAQLQPLKQSDHNYHGNNVRGAYGAYSTPPQAQGGLPYSSNSDQQSSAESEHGQGASPVESAGGGFAGHELGAGLLGVVGGAIAGAVGANWLENKHVEKDKTKKHASDDNHQDEHHHHHHSDEDDEDDHKHRHHEHRDNSDDSDDEDHKHHHHEHHDQKL